MMARPTVIRIALFLSTVVAIWGVLSLGAEGPQNGLEAGDIAPETIRALQSAEVENRERTEELRQAARDAVEPERRPSQDVQRAVEQNINAVFTDIATMVLLDFTPPTITPPELPEPEAEEPGSEPQPEASIEGQVFLDVNGNGVFDPPAEVGRSDVGVGGLTFRITTHDGVTNVTTNPDGTWAVEINTDVAVVELVTSNGQIPQGWMLGIGQPAVLVECDPGETCSTNPISFIPALRPVGEAVEEFLSSYPGLSTSTAEYLAATAADDVIRPALGEELHMSTVQQETLRRMNSEFGLRIAPDQLADTQNSIRTSPPLIFHRDTGLDEPGREASADILVTHLLPNYIEDENLTREKQEAAAAAVQPVMVSIREGETIVNEGQVVTEFHIAAINATALRVAAADSGSLGLLAVLAVLVGVVGMYLSRFRKEIWSRPRMVALLGILMVLAAASVRGTAFIAESTNWYLLPVVAFGFMTAILFDQRIALLMAMSVGVVTAVGTQDLGLTVYAALATMAPIPFVSAVSSRGAFRNAVALSAVAAAGIAAATSWFFHVGPNDNAVEVVGQAALWAFGASAIASLIAPTALQFFESAFDVTTTLRLLDLTDRNHQGLQLLQEKAFGTFNHSLMVGTLADAAARAIGANPLLARAMAYYHDLGKTENPTYFIENQFGMQNPHDFIDPKESAEILRGHVPAGIALARQFKIPTDVAQGIVSHHGDGVMRYFYEKARSEHGDVIDVDDFRHIGHKPRTAETAILMLADSLEAACRAVFQVEEPTPDAIEKVVNRIIDEKVEDGQLSEAPLTLAQLTQVRKAFLDSLVGHYHQRIAYPNFPGS